MPISTQVEGRIHLPLTTEAKAEILALLLSNQNMLYLITSEPMLTLS